MFAAYLLLTARKGISSLQLSKELSVTQKTAWYMLHRLRLGCETQFQALRGEIEIDETYVGGKARNRHAKKQQILKDVKDDGKVPVLGMRERGGKTVGMPIEGTDRFSLHTEIRGHVATGSTTYTDDAAAYSHPNRIGYLHETVNHSAKEFVNGMVHTNGIESVWAVLKRGYNGVYHNWSQKHCRQYVNEFAFRLGDGSCSRDTQDRLDALFRGLTGHTITYRVLTS